MSDSPKKQGFSGLIKLFGMLGLAAVMMAAGGFGANLLLQGKHSSPEENPSEHSEDSQDHLAHSEHTQADEHPSDHHPPGEEPVDSPPSQSHGSASHDSASHDSTSAEDVQLSDGHSHSEDHSPSEHHSQTEKTALADNTTDSEDPAESVESEDHRTSGEVVSEDGDAAATQSLGNAQIQADEMLRSGDYARALRNYKALRKIAQHTEQAPLQFRLAMTAEMMGNFGEALAGYQKILASPQMTSWYGVARLGEARCLLAMKRHETLQSDVLRSVVLDETSIGPTSRTELIGLLGRSLVAQLGDRQKQDLLADDQLIVPLWQPDTGQLLDQLPELIREQTVPVSSEVMAVIQIKDAVPDEIILTVHTPRTDVQQLLQNLVRRCHFKFEDTELSVTAMESRSVLVRLTEVRLSQILDGLTIPFGNVWTFDGSKIRIAAREQVSSPELVRFQLDSARRLLEIALQAPESTQSGYNRLAMGSLLFQQQKPEEAAGVFLQQFELEPHSRLASASSFNLAKCEMRLGHPDEARQMFLRTVDAGQSSNPIRVASYLYTGRLLIEMGRSKNAVNLLMRGLMLSENTDLEPRAAMALASCYLLTSQPQAAASVLMERRDKLDTETYRDAAAFLSTAAAFNAAILADRREREGQKVLGALSRFDASKQFGCHWNLIAAAIAEELGLNQQAIGYYSAVLDARPAAPLQNEAVLRLSGLLEQDQKFEDARRTLSRLSPGAGEQLEITGLLKSAQVSMEQQQYADAISYCRQLVAKEPPKETLVQAFKIMGRSYEKLGNPRAAIYCYSGMLPAEQPSSVPADSKEMTRESPGGHQ